MCIQRPGTPATDAVSSLAAKLGSTPDAVCIAAVIQQPFKPLVLSGAVTPEQIRANAAALQLSIAPEDLAELMQCCAASPDNYWKERSALPWN